MTMRRNKRDGKSSRRWREWGEMEEVDKKRIMKPFQRTIWWDITTVYIKCCCYFCVPSKCCLFSNISFCSINFFTLRSQPSDYPINKYNLSFFVESEVMPPLLCLDYTIEIIYIFAADGKSFNSDYQIILVFPLNYNNSNLGKLCVHFVNFHTHTYCW